MLDHVLLTPPPLAQVLAVDAGRTLLTSRDAVHLLLPQFHALPAQALTVRPRDCAPLSDESVAAAVYSKLTSAHADADGTVRLTVDVTDVADENVITVRVTTR